MECNCASNLAATTDVVTKTTEALDRCFEFMGIPLVAQRFRDLCTSATKASQAAQRLEKARILNLDSASTSRTLMQSARHRSAAARAAQSLSGMIQERMKMPEWQQALKISQSQDPRNVDPNTLFNELTEEATDQMLASNMSPAMCARINSILSKAIGVARGGLEPAMRAVVASMGAFEAQLHGNVFEKSVEAKASHLNTFEKGAETSVVGHPDDGPITESLGEYLACQIAAVAVFCVAVAACGCIPFCWCCVAPILIAGFIFWLNACEDIPH